MRADHLTQGHIVSLKGNPWTVSLVSGTDPITLTVTSERGVPYSATVPAGQEFEIVGGALVVPEDVAEVPAELAEIGASFLYYVDEAGRYVVQTPDELTVAAHLLTFHGVTWEGVSLNESRTLLDHPERTMTPQEAAQAADFIAMLRLHDDLHAQPDLPVPHVHVDIRRNLADNAAEA